MTTTPTNWTWKVTYQTATIAKGSEATKEQAERAAWSKHDTLAIGLNPDDLAYFVDEVRP
jgi:hypothetical protein